MSEQEKTHKKINGYHGTSAYSINKIKENNFKISTGEREWYGNGTYFFINRGPFRPEKCAKMWAKYKKYSQPAVIEVEVILDKSKIIDLDYKESWEIWEEFENLAILFFKKKYGENFCKTTKNDVNRVIYNFISSKYDAVIARSHVKFGERGNNDYDHRPSFVPNCCIMCIYNPEDSIDRNKIREVRD